MDSGMGSARVARRPDALIERCCCCCCLLLLLLLPALLHLHAAVVNFV